MITLKINLRQLDHALMKTPKGVDCIVIPIEPNKLFKSEKAVYLDVVGFDYDDKSDKQYKDTHLLKQSFSKEYLASLSEAEKKALPILGNARVAGSTGHAEPKPKGSSDVAAGIDDLPF
jgi:hypothetical protein